MSYEYWEKAMANPAALHNREFSITTTPEPGYYRTYRLHEPVAIWHETMDGREDQVIVIVNGLEVPVEDHETVWLSCAKNPVSEEWYRIVEAGGIWPDLDEAVAGVGHNRRFADDPEGLIDDYSRQAEAYVVITDDEMAQRALSLRSAILEQHKRADTSREEAKKPHLTAARQVDEMWMPMVKKAKKWADYLRIMVEAYETHKRKLAREAEVKRQQDEAVDIDASPEPKAQIRSGYGRAVSVSEKPIVVGITNVTALVHYLQHSSAQQEMLFAYLMELAQKEVNSGATVPGVTVEMKAVLR